MKRLFKGFTLAEVLITLGIIGVVAAVTLPSLQVNVNKQALSTQIAKTYSQFSNAIQLYMQDNGLSELDNESFGKDAIMNFEKNYLQMQYVCKTLDTNCFADEYTLIDNNNGTFGGQTIALFRLIGTGGILKDGTHFVIAVDNSEGKSGTLVFDVNGKKGPNKLGYDLFNIPINNDGSIGRSKEEIFGDPEVLATNTDKLFEECKTSLTRNAYGCFLHLQQNNFKFDY